jgi:hypothetical protein
MCTTARGTIHQIRRRRVQGADNCTLERKLKKFTLRTVRCNDLPPNPSTDSGLTGPAAPVCVSIFININLRTGTGCSAVCKPDTYSEYDF